MPTLNSFDEYYHSFYFGSAFMVSLSGLCGYSLTTYLFGFSPLNWIFISLDMLMIYLAILDRYCERNLFYAVSMVVIQSMYYMSFTIVGYLLVYKSISSRFRFVLVMVNCLMFLAWAVMMSEYVGFIEHGSILPRLAFFTFPIPFTFYYFIARRILKVIKSNPMYKTNVKQKNVMKFLQKGVMFIIPLDIICFTLISVGAARSDGKLVVLGFTVVPFMKLLITRAYFEIQYNKSLEEETVMTGASKFA